MRQLLVRPIARAEIEAAFDWYLERSAAVASQFLDAIDGGLTRITEMPEAQAIIRGRLRRVLLHRFPYAIYYKVYPSRISVVGVIHGHRHPATWLSRSAL
ncbi:MAG: type II toxin-antitoxin system RelE/ParE family toxin [Gemmatimonadales bacterium]